MGAKQADVPQWTEGRAAEERGDEGDVSAGGADAERLQLFFCAKRERSYLLHCYHLLDKLENKHALLMNSQPHSR